MEQIDIEAWLAAVVHEARDQELRTVAQRNPKQTEVSSYLDILNGATSKLSDRFDDPAKVLNWGEGHADVAAVSRDVLRENFPD